jgi:hypothetical protein
VTAFVAVIVGVGKEGHLLGDKAGHSLACNVLIVVISLDSALTKFSVGVKWLEHKADHSTSCGVIIPVTASLCFCAI